MLHIIGGKHKKRKLTTPKTTLVRPTAAMTREAVFNICQHEVQGARFLDLFAGSGAIGLEALSRGASHVTFVEKERLSLAAIKQNLALLKEEEHATVIPGDVLKIIPSLIGPFDLIYVDPPYGKGLGAQALAALDASNLLAPHGLLFIEESTLLEPPLQKLQLKQKRTFGRATLFEYVLRENY